MGAFWSVATSVGSLQDLPNWVGPQTLHAVWTDPDHLGQGLSFSIPLLLILLCHELGHYLVCRYYGLHVTPPYFLPFPTALGTLGAFIRIRSAIRSKKQLFDIGVSGPIAGFLALVPFLFLGVALSEPTQISLLPIATAFSGNQEIVLPGASLLMQGTTWLVHGTLSEGTVLIPHPFVLAAWGGLLATSINLLPLAQLDGGHILYAVLGPRQRKLAVPLWMLLLIAGWLWGPWWFFWALIVLILGLIHPPVFDEHQPLDRTRLAVAGLALLLLILSFMPIPLEFVPIQATAG